MRWGLLGYGRIARKFVENLMACEGQEFKAIASKSFKAKDIENVRFYHSYDELLADPEVDIVYISTIHNLHYQNTLAALAAGKHVLCEKPMAVSKAQVVEMIAAAESNQRFLMEALWTRFLPAYQEFKKILHTGVIGDVKWIQANFSFAMNPDEPKERLIKKELAGGAIWDVGVYAVALIHDLYKEQPNQVKALANMSAGIEKSASVSMNFSQERQAHFYCGFELQTPNQATIVGEKGHIILDDFWKCESFSVHTNQGVQKFKFPFISTGFYHEIVACAEAISQAKNQSSEMSWNESVELAKITDLILAELHGN